MTWLADLSPCTYVFPGPNASQFLSVGWLEPSHPYSQGEVSEPVFSPPVRTPGRAIRSQDVQRISRLRALRLCPPRGPVRGFSFCSGATNLYVPHEPRAVIFVAPSLIAHYIAEHDYKPPDEFSDAIAACPAMGSNEYIDALVECGPQDDWWIRSIQSAQRLRAAVLQDSRHPRR